MSEEIKLPERPPLKHLVELDDGEKQSIHMTYGLWNDFQRVMPDPSVVIEGGLSDPYLRDYILRRCFTDAKKMIEEEKDLIPVDQMKLSDPIEVQKLLSWVTGHLLYFFAASATALKAMGSQFQLTIAETPVAPSSTGQEVSA